uniref:Reverse transcriptase domain-containing protein n=1 Tax=Fagus sylvatica TaxID=28930 RepID=A0A2N9J1A1_FAGSY
MVETKAKSPKIDRLKVSTEFAHCFCVDSVGKAGGLAIFWKAGVEMEEVYSDRFVIALLIYSDPPDAAWLLIAVHGPPYLALRKKFWSLMENIIGSFSGLWLMIGDLNSISGNSEKKGGFSGSKFTWSNRRVGLANIRERLDRGLCNADWQQVFPKARVPDLSGLKQCWTRDDSSYEVVNNAWAIFVEGSQHSQLAKRSQSIRKEFLVWNKYHFGHVKTRIMEIEEKLKLIQDLEPTQDNLKIEAALTLELNEWLECLLSPCISQSDNSELTKIPDPIEIKEVVWAMHPLKAPGPDGLPGIFFKHYWDTVGPQVIDAIQSFFRDGSQAAFVPGRWIAENVALAQEVVHSFKSSKKKHGSVGFKLDFHKAYDILEWNFILAVLRNLGFDQRFITLIYQCISMVSFTLLLNGSRSVKITPERGIRQGDPLSPYLFILCNEVLARMLNREVDRGLLRGLSW